MFIMMPFISNANTTDDLTKEQEKELEALVEHSADVSIDILDADEKKAEEPIYDDEGNKIGVMGVEEVNREDVDNGDIGTQQTVPTGQNVTYNVYWYAATVNYWFDMTVYVDPSTGLGEVVRAFDANYIVIPPGIVGSSSLDIIQQQETSSTPAEARYTLSMSAPVSTNMWIYGQVSNGTFTTGAN
ncbi:hypothetical protein DH09_12240 [Bacillaceae bacterium JMAK1]|nr:hypothetical protein DH09_12240 [Bacillaceae bacterium JMAK1]